MNRQRLLRFCLLAMAADTNGIEAELRQMLPQMDWPKFIQLSSAHLIICSVYCGLRQRGLLELVPGEVAEFLGELYERNAQRNTAICRQLMALSATLDGAGIRAILLKSGAGFATGLYREVGERVVLDIDLLVREAMLPSAVEALLYAGYSDPRSDEPYASRSYHHTPLVHEEWPAAVELHFRPLEPAYETLLPPEAIFAAALDAEMMGQAVLVPSPTHRVEHCLAHSQLHHQHHRFRRVPVRDLWEFVLLRKQLGDEVDWAGMQGRFAAAGWPMVLPSMVAAAARYFALPPPTGIAELSRTPYVLEPERNWPTLPSRVVAGVVEKLERNFGTREALSGIPGKTISPRAWGGLWRDLLAAYRQHRYK